MKLNGPNVVLKQSEEVNVSEFLPFKTFSFSIFLTAIEANSLSSLSYLTFFLSQSHSASTRCGLAG